MNYALKFNGSDQDKKLVLKQVKKAIKSFDVAWVRQIKEESGMGGDELKRQVLNTCNSQLAEGKNKIQGKYLETAIDDASSHYTSAKKIIGFFSSLLDDDKVKELELSLNDLKNKITARYYSNR